MQTLGCGLRVRGVRAELQVEATAFLVRPRRIPARWLRCRHLALPVDEARPTDLDMGDIGACRPL